MLVGGEATVGDIGQNLAGWDLSLRDVPRFSERTDRTALSTNLPQSAATRRTSRFVQVKFRRAFSHSLVVENDLTLPRVDGQRSKITL